MKYISYSTIWSNYFFVYLFVMVGPQIVLFYRTKDSFITQDRNDDFEGGQVESTFSWGHCDLTSGTILNK